MAPTGSVLSNEKGQAECDSLAAEVERIWRRSRPKLMRRLDTLKNVKDRTQQAALHCQETTEHLREHGVPWDQANGIARYEWIYLPDIDAEDDVS